MEATSTQRLVRRGLAWSTASNLAMRCANLGVGAVMARLIAPEQFGVFAVAVTVWLLLGALAEFGLGADLIRREDYERYIPTVATLGAILSTVIGGVMALSAGVVADAFGSRAATPVIQVMALPVVLIGFSVVPAALLQRQLRQGTQFAIDGTSLAVSTALMIVLAVAGLGPMALALSRLVGQLWTMVWQYVAVRRRPRFGWNRDLARQAVAFGLPLALANLVAWSNLSLDNFVVAREIGPVGLGLYALAFNVASWPMSVAGQSVRVVALPAFSRLTSVPARARAMVTVCGPIWAVSLVLAVGLMAMATPVVTVLYGARWHGAVAALVPLAAFGALRVVFDLMATFLIAAGRTRSVLWVQVAWLLALGPAMVVGVRIGGLAGAGWAHVAVGAGVVLPGYFLALSGVQVRAHHVLRAWLLPTVAVVPLAAVLWLGVGRVSSPALAMPAAALCGVLLFALPLAPWALRTLRSLTWTEDDPGRPGTASTAAPPARTRRRTADVGRHRAEPVAVGGRR